MPAVEWIIENLIFQVYLKPLLSEAVETRQCYVFFQNWLQKHQFANLIIPNLRIPNYLQNKPYLHISICPTKFTLHSSKWDTLYLPESILQWTFHWPSPPFLVHIIIEWLLTFIKGRRWPNAIIIILWRWILSMRRGSSNSRIEICVFICKIKNDQD